MNYESPSPVLHIRSVPPEATENDLIQCISTYSAGRNVVSVRLLEKYQQALVEMDSIETASRVIKFAQDTPLKLYGKPIQISFSKSKTINIRPIGNVLLVTIENATMSVNVDILHRFFSFYGEVLRIVIFTKTELQALVEFANPENAYNAKTHLHNVSIYQGGICVLKIEVSKTERLNVTTNNDRTKDYTKSLPSNVPALTPAPYYAGGNAHGHGNGHHQGHHYQQQSQHQTPHQQALAQQQAALVAGIPPRTTVLMVYGLDESIMTCERIFNLFCVYGNVQKIKILPNKKGTAMVQMEDAQQADTIISYYNQISLFGQPLHIMYSKHQSITDSHNPESQSNSRDFISSPFKRFSHSIATYKHLYKPSQTLYFSNVPKEFTESAFYQLFTSMNTHKPIGIKFFQLQPAASTSTTSPSTNGTSTSTTTTSTTTNGSTSNGLVNGNEQNGTSNSKSIPATASDKSVGLLEFQNQQQALEALVYVNNTQIPGTHSNIRLSFSNSTVLPQPPRSSSNQQQQQQQNINPSTPTLNNKH